MTVPEQVPVTEQVANGVTVKFFVQFQYANKNDLHIHVDGVEPSISEVYFDDNSFNFYAAPAAGKIIRIERITPKERDTDYDQSDNTFRPRVVNADFDKIWYSLQEAFNNLDEETKKRIEEDKALKDYFDQTFIAFSNEVNARFESKWTEIAEYLNATLPMFFCIMKKELALYEETGLIAAIESILESTSLSQLIDEYIASLDQDFVINTKYFSGAFEFDPDFVASGGKYPLNTQLRLTNGDIVKSTVANNVIDPNFDMTDWVKTKDASQIFDESGKSQQEINNSLKNRDIYVDDYFAGSGVLRPVSDLYTVGSSVYDKRFKTLTDVKVILTAATLATDPLDWAAIQTCVDIFRAVKLSAKFYYIGDKAIEIPTTCTHLKGTGDLTRIYSTGLKAVKAKDGQRIVHGKYGGFYLLGSMTANSIGFDASGFSYNTIEDIYIRQFEDGWYADGSTSPVNKQYSNNTVINVRSNNNLDRGFRFVGSSEANSANTYIGCEGAGNIRGWDEVVGYSNQCVGCTFQGNSELDFYTDGQRNIYQFYTEGNPKSIKLGSLSRNNKIDIRSSYPLWNTCDDEGMENTKSVRGEISVDSHVFKNPYFENWISAVPINTLPNGAAAFSWFSDTNLSKGGGLQIVFNANFQGFILQGLDPKINYAGRWVTVQIEADTSGITDLTGLRIYTRDGSTNNGTSGEFAVSNWKKTTAGQYKNFTFDVKFPATIAGIPTILIYLAYDGITTTNTIRISATKVILGQKDRIGEYALSSKATSSAATNFTSATSGLNSAWKTPPRFIYNSTSGKMYYASGSSATSAWKALDGSADIVPI